MDKAIIYLSIFVASMSAITFFTYGIDKWKAKRHAWRISEKLLLILSLLGGVIGAIIAMQLFHHKTTKWYFWFTHIIAIILWCAIYGILLYF